MCVCVCKKAKLDAGMDASKYRRFGMHCAAITIDRYRFAMVPRDVGISQTSVTTPYFEGKNSMKIKKKSLLTLRISLLRC